MNGSILALVVIVVFWSLLLYILDDFLLLFKRKNNGNDGVKNNKSKALLYVLAILVLGMAYFAQEKDVLMDLVLLFVILIELISCFKKQNSASITKKCLEHTSILPLIGGISVVCFAVILVPKLIAALTNNVDQNAAWIDFWGGYLGAIIGGIITLYVMHRTMKKEKKLHDRSEKIQYFDKVIEVVSLFLQSSDKVCACIKTDLISQKKVSSELGECVNLMYAQSNQLFLLLSTRDKIYEVSELLASYRIYAGIMNRFMDEHREIFDNNIIDQQRIQNVLEQLSNIDNYAETIRNCIEKTVKRNLYNV